MQLADAIRAVIATMRRRPAELFPFYMLALAVPAIVRVLAFIGIAAILVYLIESGRIAAFRGEIAGLEGPPDAETDPTAFAEWMESLVPAIELLFTPTSVGILFLTLVISAITLFFLMAAVTAGQLATCFGCLRSENGLLAGIAGLRRYWLRMAGLYLLEIALWIMLTLIVVTVIAVAAVISIILAIFVGIFAGLAWIVGAVLIRGVFVFAPVALIVDDDSITGAVRNSGGFIRAEFMHAVSYYAIAIGVLLGYATFTATMAGIGAPSIATLVSFLVIAPALDLLKTVMFGEYREAIRPPDPPVIGLGEQVKQGTRRALRETSDFVRETPVHHGVAVLAMAVGFGMGWIAAEPLVPDFSASIEARTGEWFPPTASLDIFGNNWTVALSTAFAGVAAGIPVIVNLWFNGFAFAIFGRLEVAPLELIAFVIPHGIIEIPAILIAGAVGLHLGIVTWRTWRGRADRATLAAALGRSFWVLIGVGVLLALAGVIEGFVSPYYYRLFL